MAWKRIVQNNQAGVIRKGHIREFLQPSSKDTSISFKLRISDICYLPDEVVDVLKSSGAAFANFDFIDESVLHFASRLLRAAECAVDEASGGPEGTESGFRSGSVVYIHAHKHPSSVIALAHSPFLDAGIIALSESHRLNAKVCVGEMQEWTVYQGRRVFLLFTKQL
jgi:hypothetical protein